MSEPRGELFQYQQIVEPISVEVPPPSSGAGVAVNLWFVPAPVVIHVVEAMVGSGTVGIKP